MDFVYNFLGFMAMFLILNSPLIIIALIFTLLRKKYSGMFKFQLLVFALLLIEWLLVFIFQFKMDNTAELFIKNPVNTFKNEFGNVYFLMSASALNYLLYLVGIFSFSFLRENSK